MEIININTVRSEIREKENQINLYAEKIMQLKVRVLPKSKQLSNVMVDSSRDVTDDKLLHYVAQKEEYERIISELTEDLYILQKFEEEELKRLNEFGETKRQVIYYKDLGNSWGDIQRFIDLGVIKCSLSTARRMYKDR